MSVFARSPGSAHLSAFPHVTVERVAEAVVLLAGRHHPVAGQLRPTILLGGLRVVDGHGLHRGGRKRLFGGNKEKRMCEIA